MAVTAIVGVLGAAATYAGAKKQANAVKEAAANQQVADSAEIQANALAASNATKRDAAAREAEANAALAGAQMSKTPTVTADNGDASARRRVVQASFNLDGAASSGTGSIRV